jgi:hypothetical protein
MGTAAQASPATFVTPRVERHAMATTWSLFSAAFAEDDTSMLRKTTTPTMDDVVHGWFSCGCAPWPVAVTNVSFSAPPQKKYPLWFYAEIQGIEYDGTPLIKEAMFTRASPNRPWLVTYLGGFIGGSPLFGRKSLNYERRPSPEPQSPARIPQEFANFFQQVDQSGSAPPLPKGFVNEGIISENIAGDEQLHQSRKAADYTDVYSHTVTQVSPAFAAPQGDVVCAAMDTGDAITSEPGSPMVQPQNRGQWGTLLAPGSYRSLSEHLVFDTCFLELFGSGNIELLTSMGGPISISGTPSSQ